MSKRPYVYVNHKNGKDYQMTCGPLGCLLVIASIIIFLAGLATVLDWFF